MLKKMIYSVPQLFLGFYLFKGDISHLILNIYIKIFILKVVPKR